MSLNRDTRTLVACEAELMAAEGMPDFDVPTLRRYWADPAFRAEILTVLVANRARANAAIDEGIRKYREGKRP
jgi:hypothetical protein